MDVAEATRSLLALAPQQALARLDSACSVRRNGKPIDAREALEELCGAGVEATPKRNLCFLRWRRGETEGAAIVAWDQQEKVVALELYG